MSELADFLLARIAEDEAAVNDRTRHLTPGGWSYLEQFGDFGDDERWMIEIPAARVLAECAAKQRIVERYQRAQAAVETDQRRVDAGGYSDERGTVGEWGVSELRPVLGLLALPYADHPDWREEWRT